MLYNAAFRSAEAFILVEPDQDDIILTLDPNQQEPLIQKINPDPQDVILHWIQISSGLYSRGYASTICNIKPDPDPLEPLFQRKHIQRMPYNTGS